MANISSLLFWRHLRAAPTSHLIFHKNGKLVRRGRGLAFWFMPLGTSLTEVPLEDRELSILVRGRSSDFQEVVIQGVVTYRIKDPEVIAERVDFGLNTKTGKFEKDPLEKLTVVVTELAQQLAVTDLTRSTLREVLVDGIGRVKELIHDGLSEDEGLASLGLEIVSTRITSIKPSAELERALQMPARESIQQQADEATFARRALAVEKERAIAENELGNQIELARREEQLIQQRGQNERTRATDAKDAKRIEAEAAAEQARLAASAQAEGITVVESARVAAERERIAIYQGLSQTTMLGLAAREFATNLHAIEHLTVTPDMLTPVLARLARGGAES
jgi:regulator of protease activity HflC (stomatin/prohibitin superfamily)